MDLIVRDANFGKIPYSKQTDVLTPISFSATYGQYGSSANDFQMTVPLDPYAEPIFGQYVVYQNTEFGGRITRREIDTKNNRVTYSGKTLRGQLDLVILNRYPHSVVMSNTHTETIEGVSTTVPDRCGDAIRKMINMTPLNGTYKVSRQDDDFSPAPSSPVEIVLPERCTLFEGIEIALKAHACKMSLVMTTSGIHVKIRGIANTKLIAEYHDLKITEDLLLPNAFIGSVDIYRPLDDQHFPNNNISVYVNQNGNLTTNDEYRYTGMSAYETLSDLGEIEVEGAYIGPGIAQAVVLAKSLLREKRAVSFVSDFSTNEELDLEVGDFIRFYSFLLDETQQQIIIERSIRDFAGDAEITFKTGGAI